MKWCCQLLQSVAKSRAEFYFVQCYAQQEKLQDNPRYTVQFSAPATCLATTLRDKLLRKLRSVTEPFKEIIFHFVSSFFTDFAAKTINWYIVMKSHQFEVTYFTHVSRKICFHLVFQTFSIQPLASVILY